MSLYLTLQVGVFLDDGCSTPSFWIKPLQQNIMVIIKELFIIRYESDCYEH
jgi:hypothetical protein